jgi:uncharacterized caspase-like protein
VALATVVALLAACAGTPSTGSSKRVALVIGNAAYTNAPALGNPVNDANDMCAALRSVGFATLCHVNVRDRAEFEAHVKEYVDRLGPNTDGVVFYSGHGVQAGSANFLIPTDVQPRSVTEDPLHVLYGVDDLFDSLRQKPSRFQLVILDACRTDLFVQAPRTVQGGGRGPTVPTGSLLVRSLETVSRASSGLGPIRDAPPGTIVLYATASKEAAYDGQGRNGPLTKHVLSNIHTSGQTIDQFLNQVISGVESETTRAYGKRQTPFVYRSFSGDFCFAGCRAIVPGVN